MLTVKDVEFLDKSKLSFVKKKTKKNQILLFDTQRKFDHYLAKLAYRKNGKNLDIPHFIITKTGIVYQIFDTNYYSETFNVGAVDKKQIKIALENLGWLVKNTITGVLSNWIGDPYRTEPYVKSWRNHFFWDTYTEQQLNSLSLLCDNLCEKHNITKQSINTQAYFTYAHNFNGIICKSNFSDIYTDINPSFNFNIFFKNDKEQNEQLR